MALTSVAKGTSRKESLLQEILIQINNKKEGLLKELKLLNEIEAELKSTTLYTAIANEPQPVKKSKKQEIQEAVKRATAWSKERKARKTRK
jgi:hypothetical protein